MRGADERGVTPVGTLISLASLDSFPFRGRLWAAEGGGPYG